MPGCRGRQPPAKQTYSPPLPAGKGAGGISFPFGEGGQKQSQRQGRQAAKQSRPPPLGAWFAPCPSAARVQPRGCKGRSPLHKITLSPPLPAGKGAGGMGAEKQSKGRVGRRQSSHAPLPPPETTRKVRNRVQTAAPDNKISGKVLGGLGASFKKPPTLLRFSASPLLCSPSPADYPFRLQSCMALFTSPETRHSIPRQATGKRSERRESSEGEKSERTQAARS